MKIKNFEICKKFNSNMIVSDDDNTVRWLLNNTIITVVCYDDCIDIFNSNYNYSKDVVYSITSLIDELYLSMNLLNNDEKIAISLQQDYIKIYNELKETPFYV